MTYCASLEHCGWLLSPADSIQRIFLLVDGENIEIIKHRRHASNCSVIFVPIPRVYRLLIFMCSLYVAILRALTTTSMGRQQYDHRLEKKRNCLGPEQRHLFCSMTLMHYHYGPPKEFLGVSTTTAWGAFSVFAAPGKPAVPP